MGQKYNPSTGQWEDDEADDALGGGLGNIFGGSSGAVDGSAMTGGAGTANTAVPSGVAAIAREGYVSPYGYSDQYAGNRYSLGEDGQYTLNAAGNYTKPVVEMDSGAYQDIGAPPAAGTGNINYGAAIQPLMASKYGWGSRQQEYSDRFGSYFNTLEKQIGSPLRDFEVLKGGDSAGGYIFKVADLDGKQYAVEVPHSPGGKFYDYNTAGMPGWNSLGLGDLGGEGNEKIPGNSGASYINFDQYKGMDPSQAIFMDNINPEGKKFGIGELAMLAAAIYSGGAALGAWGPGATAAGAGGAALGGGELASAWAALEGTPTLMMGGELAAGGAGAFSSLQGFGGLGLDGLSGAVSDLGSIFSGDLPAGINGMDGSALSSISNNPSGVFNTGVDPSGMFNPGSDALMSATDYVPGSTTYSSVEGMDPFATTEGVNQGFNRATGYGLDNMYGKNNFGLPTGTGQELKNMYNFMTNPIGGQRPGLFQAPSPLNTLFRGVGALDSWNSNREAMDYLENARNNLNGNAMNPNRPRGDFANQQWMANVQNPQARHTDWMRGAGAQLYNQLAAKAAASGRRNSYLNSGALNRDLQIASNADFNNYANTLKGGFEANVDNTNARAAYDSAMIPMIKNQNSPLFQWLGNTGMQYGLSELFGGGGLW